VLLTAKTQKSSLSRPTCLLYAGMYRSTQGRLGIARYSRVPSCAIRYVQISSEQMSEQVRIVAELISFYTVPVDDLPFVG